jgi:hypothetical protein
MKRRVVGGVVFSLLVAVLWAFRIFALPIYVNGETLPLEPPVLMERGSVLVPIEEFGLAIGVETTADAERLVLRWSGGRYALDVDRYAVRSGIAYATLEWMVGLVGGDVHHVGEAWYVETTTAFLIDIEATAERVVLRFDGFAPVTTDESADGTELRLTVHHCRSQVEPQLIMLGGEAIASVRLPSGERNSVNVSIALEEGAIMRRRTYESPSFYSFCLEAGDRSEEEQIIQIGEGLVLHQLMTVVSTGAVRADWLYVEAWRDRYRLAPVFPSTGFGAIRSIEELAGSINAVAAVNLGCPRTPVPVDLLVIDGAPYVDDDETRDGLGLDLFGWWTFFSADAKVFAKHRGESIPIDDVNRPILYGEVVAYPPGYVGTIARGVPGSFVVVKIRCDRVVSVYEGPFVTPDSTATLLVASGEAKARLSLVRLGDPLHLECDVGPEGATFAHAFSAGPILVDSGVSAAVPESRAVASFSGDSPSGWIILATDWHGGLTLLSYAHEEESEARILSDLIAFLASMPVPIRDAIVVSRCNDNALIVRDPPSTYRLGSGDPYALALCLVPIAP